MAFRKGSPKFDDENYENWKEKMNTHFLCMRIDYWLIKRDSKTMIEDKYLGSYYSK